MKPKTARTICTFMVDMYFFLFGFWSIKTSLDFGYDTSYDSPLDESIYSSKVVRNCLYITNIEPGWLSE